MPKLTKIEQNIQAILFAAGEPYEKERLAKLLEIDRQTLEQLVERINEWYEDTPFILLELDQCYQMATRAEYAQVIRQALEVKNNTPLSQAALEVLGMPPEECYCTLLFYAAHADGRWLCGHIGDGYIFRIRQDTAVVFSAPENGHASNETYFLSEPGAAQHLRIRSGELHEPYAVLLTSDGGGDTLFDRQQQQPAPAVERLCDWLTENDEKTVTEALAHVIKEKMIPATEDDVSVAILYCGEDE